MGEFYTLSEEQQRILDACNVKSSSPSMSLRSISWKHAVPYSLLRRACKRSATEKAILQTSDGGRRKFRQDKAAERIISDIVLEFQANGTPLDRNCVLDVA